MTINWMFAKHILDRNVFYKNINYTYMVLTKWNNG